MYLSVYLSDNLSSFSHLLSSYLASCLSIYLPTDLSKSNLILSYLVLSYLIYLSNLSNQSIYLSIYLSNLSIYPSIYLSIYLSIQLSFHLSIYPSIYLSIYLPIYLSVCLSIYLSFFLSIYLSVCLSIHLSICKLENQTILPNFFMFQSWQHQKRSNSARLPHVSKLTTSKTKQFSEISSMFARDNVKNEAILRDFPIVRSWQHQKRSNSAGLLHFVNLTISKTKQFCETPSMLELDNIENKTHLRDFLQKCKVNCSADGLVPMRFAIFPLHLSKALRLPRKSDIRSYEVLHLSRKIILANLNIWCSKMQPLSGNQRPDLLTSLMNMSFVLRLPRDMHLRRSSSNVPRLPSFLEMLQNHHVLLTFEKVHNPLRLPRETTSERQKVVRTPGVFNILTSKCASRHNGVHFLTSQLPKVVRAWCALFCTFWLRNVLRATKVCTFSTSQLPKVVRE